MYKKKQQIQKQNSYRLSNSKISNVYSSVNKINCTQINPYLQEKQKIHNKKINRVKSTRKHQQSLQNITTLKSKQIKQTRSSLFQKQKIKYKKKRKQKIIDSSRLMQIYDFSKSNSLIAFSQRDSTINKKNQVDKPLFKTKINTNQVQAAIKIQKTWRGYLTRKLLQQYINYQQQKLNQIIDKNELKLNQNNELNFSEFSQINQYKQDFHEENQYFQQFKPIRSKQIDSFKKFKHTQSSSHKRSFFQCNNTEPASSSEKKVQQKIFDFQISPKKQKLQINSQIYKININIKTQKNRKQSINEYFMQINNKITQFYLQNKNTLKQRMCNKQLDIDELIKRNNKIKQQYENSKQFIQNIQDQMLICFENIKNISTSSTVIQSDNNNRMLRSQMFTFDSQTNQQNQYQNEEDISEGQYQLKSYVSDLLSQFQNNQYQTQLQYLCQIIKLNSERGVKNITQRCLIQFTVQIITQNYPLSQILNILKQKDFKNLPIQKFIVKWINELNKWEMGTIEEVTQTMQSSSFLNGEVSKSIAY